MFIIRKNTIWLNKQIINIVILLKPLSKKL